jgi:hypothetical protein
MQIYKFSSLLISVSLFLPVVTQIGEIDMQIGRMRIRQYLPGNVERFSDLPGSAKLHIPETEIYMNGNFDIDDVNSFLKNTCQKSGRILTQESRQVSRNGRYRHHSSTVSVFCN